MSRTAFALLVLAASLPPAACRRLEPRDLDAVRALRAKASLRFLPPADGLLTGSQLDAYLKVRRAAGTGSREDAADAIGADPIEMAWVRARIVEALLALEARQVTDAAFESYGAAIARLRETRRTTRDPKAAPRLDAELAGLERERASLRRGEAPSPATLKNAARLAPRRAELVALGP